MCIIWMLFSISTSSSCPKRSRPLKALFSTTLNGMAGITFGLYGGTDGNHDDYCRHDDDDHED
jgi:hypothetical protein